MIKSAILSIPVSPHGEISWQVTAFLPDAIRACAERGVTLDYHIHPGKPNTSTRNLQCTHFLKSDAEAIIFCDSDAIPDVPSLLLMLDDAARDDVDAVGGWSLMVAGGNTLVPNIMGQANENGEGAVLHGIPSFAPGLYEITGGSIGAHCLLVNRHVIEEFIVRETMWFEDKFYKSPLDGDLFGTRKRGHDLLFCHRMADMGFRLWVDNRVFWGHNKTTDMREWWYRVKGLCDQLDAQKAIVDTLRESWGNTDWTAGSEFLMRMVAEASQVDGLIVECGSGLTSEILDKCGNAVVSLEDQHAGPLATKAKIVRYAEWDWYDADAVFHAINSRPIAMLIVDGPAGTTRGGRRGCLTLRDRMAPGAVVMFDDVNRKAERDLVDEWCEGMDIEVGETVCADGRSFAVLRMPEA